MPLTDAQKVVRNDTAKRMATALEGIETALGGLGTDNAKKADLTAISATGTTNATGATITAGTYFYLNGALVQAKADIASGATFTNGTNYEAVTAGGLNSLNAGLTSLNSQIGNLSSLGTLVKNDIVSAINTTFFQGGVVGDCDAAPQYSVCAINDGSYNTPASEWNYGVLITFGGYRSYQMALSNENPPRLAVRYIGSNWKILG